MVYPSQYFNRTELWKRTLLKYDRQIIHLPKVLKEKEEKKEKKKEVSLEINTFQ